jgi:hypothetical protein
LFRLWRVDGPTPRDIGLFSGVPVARAAGSARERRAFCASCGQIFVPRRSDPQYCGLTCKERAHRRRKAAPGGPQLPAGELLRRPGWDGFSAPAREAPGPALPTVSGKVFDARALIG